MKASELSKWGNMVGLSKIVSGEKTKDCTELVEFLDPNGLVDFSYYIETDKHFKKRVIAALTEVINESK
jgi:hypothetical protein